MLSAQNFNYYLPDEKIARYPLAVRHLSKLLVFNEEIIHHATFIDIDKFLPKDSLLIFNNTRVIQARLKFHKKTGAVIEVFCLEPAATHEELIDFLNASGSVRWKCLVGNLKRWKNEEVLQKTMEVDGKNISLTARNLGVMDDVFLIEFEWDNDFSFFEVLEHFGETPLPPYLKRQADEKDKETYQTVYALHHGAVAAPTAGLHFTEEVFKKLEEKRIDKAFLTLHVSAGTFQPLKVLNPAEHPMHTEQISFSRDFIEKLLNFEGKMISVGTTSLRALESLYWYGVLLYNHSEAAFFIPKLFPYSFEKNPLSLRQSLSVIHEYMKRKDIENLNGSTEIMIYPGYRFNFGDGIITNFHQPKSTLLLLIAAFIGDSWEKIYHTALEENYRFLSYGDSMLLLR